MKSYNKEETMNRLMRVALVVSLFAATANCVSETDYGPCVGAFDDKNPDLVYKLSTRNLAVGVIFFSLVLPPIFVVADETFCPVGRRK